MGTKRTWAAVGGGVAALALVATLPLSLLSGQLGNGLVALVIGIPCAAVGTLVARRQPGNPLGWLFLASAIGLFIGNDSGDYAYYSYRLGHHLPLGPAALATEQLWTAGLILFVVIFAIFPDGRLPSRSWRRALLAFCTIYAALVVAIVVATAQALAAHPLRIDVTGGLATVDNPPGWHAVVFRAELIALLALSVAFIGRQLLSWRRSTGERRQQLKWLASGAAVAIVGIVAGTALSPNGTASPLAEVLSNLLYCGVAALPAAMGVAILRYRLYEIDRIISRTLAYAIVTGLLVGVYAGLVLLATQVLGFHDQVAVAVATLVAAALFAPLRRRVQHGVDRRFNRARYDAELTVAEFAARLKDAVDLDSVRADLADVVQAALEPTTPVGVDKRARLIPPARL